MQTSHSRKIACVLGIETSCDDTAVAIYHQNSGILSHILKSQWTTHQPFGGVVPELASRDHIRFITPLIHEAITQANLRYSDLDGIAYTAGPGLIGALLVGASIAKSLAYSLGIPAIGVHHMEAHLQATMLEDPAPQYPFVALLVSGGHTQLVYAHQFGQYQLLGQSLDDAAGEAFDKSAKLLGLGYPGGPAIAKLALEGNASRFKLPRPLNERGNLNFSFSGLKTAVAHAWRDCPQTPTDRADLAASLQLAIVDSLTKKSLAALEHCQCSRLVIAGGVSANQLLRQRLLDGAKRENYQLYFPRSEFCTDNGAMVAVTGFLRFQQPKAQQSLAIDVRARWPLAEL